MHKKLSLIDFVSEQRDFESELARLFQQSQNDNEQTPENDEQDIETQEPEEKKETLKIGGIIYTIEKTNNKYFFDLNTPMTDPNYNYKKRPIFKGSSKTLEMKNNMLTKHDPRDKNSNSYPKGVIFSDEVLVNNGTPKFQVIRNYGIIDMAYNRPFTFNLIDLSNNIFTLDPRRTEGNKQEKLKSEDNLEQLKSERIRTSKQRLSKCFNLVFNDPEYKSRIENKLISNLDNPKFQPKTDVIQGHTYGETDSNINFTAHTVINYKDIEEVVSRINTNITNEYSIDLNLLTPEDISMFDELLGIDDSTEETYDDIVGHSDNREIDNTEVTRYNKKLKNYLPRFDKNKVYRNGKWVSTQRVKDENDFNREGGFTPIYRLYKKNIQEGKVKINSLSKITLDGRIVGENYEVNIYFENILPVRLSNGEIIEDSLFEPLQISYSEPIPEGLNNENLILGDSTNKQVRLFFVDTHGVITKALQKLKIELENVISYNDVLQHMVNLYQDRDNINENKKGKIRLTESQVKRLLENINNRPKKIRITEEQKNRLIKTINEEKFDDMISNFKRSASDMTPVPHDELVMMFNITKDWCRKRPNDVDCEQILELRQSLNI